MLRHDGKEANDPMVKFVLLVMPRSMNATSLCKNRIVGEQAVATQANPLPLY